MTRALWQRLADAESFLAVAQLVCAATARFGVDDCVVSLREPDGRPVVCVDNAVDVTDEQRLAWVDGKCWQHDPLWTAVCEHRAPASVDRVLLLPVIEPRGLIGTIRCRREGDFSDALRRDLYATSTHVSVQLTRLGITALGADSLSARQRDVARLAARGMHNLEIATALEISENTVKKRLKQVFAALDVGNRTELALVLRQPAVTDREAPVGITRLDALTITRGAPRRSETARAL